MRKILVILSLVVLSGCSSIKGLIAEIPSFNDTNQSARIIDVRQSIEQIDCGQPQLAQAQRVQNNLQWFHLYSESAGLRHTDVLRLTEPMEATVNEWATRAAKGEPSKIYCELKQNILRAQAKSAAAAVLGRY
jgi:hypothetical protein